MIAQETGAWREPLRRSPLFLQPEEAWFRFEQHLTAQGLCERVASTSFVAAMRLGERETLLNRVRALVSNTRSRSSFAT